ncbi:haloacid dehalogenase [Mycena galericulata]|nr:haloacid dehalogenase [Mycena galericulata]
MAHLSDVHALLFDVLGTVVDMYGSVTRELEETGKMHGIEGNWSEFAKTWRRRYLENLSKIAGGAPGSLNVDIMNREILDDMLHSEEWKHFGAALDPDARGHLNLAWHRLNGWPDTVQGLYALKKQLIIATLSNANIRLLVDMAKHADLPWDAVFSSELFEAYKPNHKVYLGALKHLSLEPQNCALVAAHIYDLRAAANLGIRTIYVRRAGEEKADIGEIKSKAEGGEVDMVVDSLTELAALLGQRK